MLRFDNCCGGEEVTWPLDCFSVESWFSNDGAKLGPVGWSWGFLECLLVLSDSSNSLISITSDVLACSLRCSRFCTLSVFAAEMSWASWVSLALVSAAFLIELLLFGVNSGSFSTWLSCPPFSAAGSFLAFFLFGSSFSDSASSFFFEGFGSWRGRIFNWRTH